MFPHMITYHGGYGVRQSGDRQARDTSILRSRRSLYLPRCYLGSLGTHPTRQHPGIRGNRDRTFRSQVEYLMRVLEMYLGPASHEVSLCAPTSLPLRVSWMLNGRGSPCLTFLLPQCHNVSSQVHQHHHHHISLPLPPLLPFYGILSLLPYDNNHLFPKSSQLQ